MGKRRSSDYILVSVSVHPVLRDYIVSTNGSDLLVPDDRGPLWVAVKSHLRQCPADYKPMTAAPVPGEIRIVLPPISASKPILNVNIDAKTGAGAANTVTLKARDLKVGQNTEVYVTAHYIYSPSSTASQSAQASNTAAGYTYATYAPDIEARIYVTPHQRHEVCQRLAPVPQA